MGLATRGKRGNGKVIEYEEQDSDDDDLTKEAIGTPLQSEDDRGEPPVKKLRRYVQKPDVLQPPSATRPNIDLQTESGSDDDYETSHNKKRKPRKSFSSTSKVKGKGKGRARLHALFDKLPTDIIYMVSAFHC
ncbi:hypothetical protein FRC00_009960 [Tulasnella sp. 408]|nr:hypothetical protein FRC00_009960 [Tulasnella sp. 408]